ncbi:hypothetical protein INR49_011058 [Caranx melampygus]|nr:hypothetical protein INR49_011058 [Caranx melampygus]
MSSPPQPACPEELNRLMEKRLTIGLTLFLTLCLDIPEAGARKEGANGESTQKRSSRSSDTKGGRCSYTFIVPQQKLTGALCLNTQSATTNHSEVALLRAELKRQQEQLEKLRGQLDQEGALTLEVRALRKESNSMNSRIAQLYAQLLHEVIHKKDQALEQQRVENLLLNATTQALQVSNNYRELEKKYGALTSMMSSQNQFIARLEKQCQCKDSTLQSSLQGFGNLDGEYWLGLEHLYWLTKQAQYKLRVVLEDWQGRQVFAEYDSFHLEPETDWYRLRLGQYQGTAGDSLSWHNNKAFTTLDRDKDSYTGNCAHYQKGGWWYHMCAHSNLNGVWYRGGHYRSRYQDGVYWAEFHGGHGRNVVEGTQYQLQCDIIEVAPAQNLTVKWYKDNEIIHKEHFTSTNKTLMTESHILKVNISREDNGAQFRCEAQLDFGPDGPKTPVLSATENVSVHYPPALNSASIQVLDTDEGGNVTLICDAESHPTPNFYWVHNGVNMTEDTDRLFVNPVNETTVYTCTATNYLGRITKEFHVNVTKIATPTPPAKAMPEDLLEGCPLTLTPAELVVKLGDPASVNCSTSVIDPARLGWEAPNGGLGHEGVTDIKWSVDKVEIWNTAPMCYITARDNKQCNVPLAMTVYNIPEIITDFPPGSVEEGDESVLKCDFINVAPVQNLTVQWYRGNESIKTERFDGEGVQPVNRSSTLKVVHERGHNGKKFSCSAELHLGPNGPNPIPTVTSEPYVADVNYKPQVKSCAEDYFPVEHNFTVDKLQCEADGNPPPKVQWFHQGELVNLSQPLTRSHSGRYKVEFSNHLGNDSTYVNITVEYGPSFSCDGHYEVKENDKFQTSCKPVGNPVPTITWFKDGKEVHQQHWTKHDGGKYVVKANNKYGTASHEVEVDVMYAPEFKDTNSTQLVTPGDNVTLSCSAEGKPAPKIWWRYIPAENVKETTRGSHEIVSITGTTYDNTGVYICVATNKFGNVSRSVTLTMAGCPLTLTPAELVVKLGDPASVNCSTSVIDPARLGWEAPNGGLGHEGVTDIKWSVDKVEIWNTAPMCYITARDNKQCNVPLAMTVYNIPEIITDFPPGPVEEGDESVLKCDFINVAPVQNLTVQWYRGNESIKTERFDGEGVQPVNRSSTLKVVHERGHNGKKFSCSAELHLGPNGPNPIPTVTSEPYVADVNYKPQVKSCAEDYFPVEHNFTVDKLQCEADGNPPPKVQWFHQGELVNLSQPLTRSHSGRYKVEFSNHLGNDSTYVYITVEYGPSFSCDGHYEVKENDKFQTSCKPVGNPVPTITWFKDGKEVHQQHWTKHDGGKYVVKANNKYGTASHEVEVDVMYAPEFKDTNSTQLVTPGGNVTLNCSAEGKPAPKIWWRYIPAENVKETTRGSHEIVSITGATSDNTGVYICVATNKFGHVSRSVTLTMADNSRQLNLWWVFIFVVIIIIIFCSLYCCYKRQKKHGQYDFVPDKSKEDIPMTAT